MKTILRSCPALCVLMLTVCALLAGPLRAEDEIEKAFRDALYAEEVKGDAEAALKAYQEVSAKFETQREMAATALFRQAECLRKLGRKDEAAAIYNRVIAQYGDKERVAKLSRENLAALGHPVSAPVPGAPSGSQDAEVARLEKLLKDSPDLINATDDSNPLTSAAEKGQVALVDYLLGKGARVDTLVDGKSALHLAAEAGHLTVCQRLLDKGANANLQTSAGATPLIMALDKGRFAVAQLLLERKVDVNAGELILVQNAENIPQGPPIRPYRRQSYPALSLALLRNAPSELVVHLLKSGAEPGKPAAETEGSRISKTWPLAEAIRRRDRPVVEAILETKFPLDQAIAGEDWPMDFAMAKASPSTRDATDDPIVEILRKHGASLKRDNVIGFAAHHGLLGYIREAVKEGASPHQLHQALYGDKLDAVKLLLELGADAQKEIEYFGDAVGVAIVQSNLAAIRLFLESGYPVGENWPVGETVCVAGIPERKQRESHRPRDFRFSGRDRGENRSAGRRHDGRFG